MTDGRTMKIIDYQDSRPIYEQIVESFKIQIFKGILQADEQMPSVRSLAMELSTNPNTVQRAYSELERQGFIYTVKGRGNFVEGDDTLKINKKQEVIDEIIELLVDANGIGITFDEVLSEVKNRIAELTKEGGKA